MFRLCRSMECVFALRMFSKKYEKMKDHSDRGTRKCTRVAIYNREGEIKRRLLCVHHPFTLVTPCP